MGKLLTRRRFIYGAGAASAMLAGCDSRAATHFLNAMGRWNDSVSAALFSPTRLAPEEPLSALTPEADFPAYFIADDMPIEPDGWILKVGGMVRNPLKLSVADLMKMPRTEMRVRHHCVEGWSAVATWAGVRVSDLARAAGADAGAGYVEYRSFDEDYYSSWDMASSMHPQTILAYSMNGHLLMPEHGAPLRLYSAVKLGYKNVKYLSEVNFMPNPSGGYWENQGYDWYAGV